MREKCDFCNAFLSVDDKRIKIVYLRKEDYIEVN